MVNYTSKLGVPPTADQYEVVLCAPETRIAPRAGSVAESTCKCVPTPRKGGNHDAAAATTRSSRVNSGWSRATTHDRVVPTVTAIPDLANHSEDDVVDHTAELSQTTINTRDSARRGSGGDTVGRRRMSGAGAAGPTLSVDDRRRAIGPVALRAPQEIRHAAHHHAAGTTAGWKTTLTLKWRWGRLRLTPPGNPPDSSALLAVANDISTVRTVPTYCSKLEGPAIALHDASWPRSIWSS